MNPFTAHTKKQGVTYIEHLHFAIGIAGRLMISVLAFATHAILPFIDIAKRHDLEATMAYLGERNDWIESQKPINSFDEQADLNAAEPHAV